MTASYWINIACFRSFEIKARKKQNIEYILYKTQLNLSYFVWLRGVEVTYLANLIKKVSLPSATAWPVGVRGVTAVPATVVAIVMRRAFFIMFRSKRLLADLAGPGDATAGWLRKGIGRCARRRWGRGDRLLAWKKKKMTIWYKMVILGRRVKGTVLSLINIWCFFTPVQIRLAGFARQGVPGIV